MRVCAAQERPTIAALASEFALDRDASYATQRTSWRSPEQSRLPAHEDEPRQPTYVRPRIDRRDEAVQRKRDREASRYPRPREWRALRKQRPINVEVLFAEEAHVPRGRDHLVAVLTPFGFVHLTSPCSRAVACSWVATPPVAPL